ncbi:MAG: vWA domain-containing protein [Woeseiaceae bacterium]
MSNFSLYKSPPLLHFLAICMSLFVFMALAENSFAAKNTHRLKKSKITDLRIIVDISGSMKKTDPKNLRRSAVRLLAGLIPDGSRSGIWNFGKQVNMAVKVGTVDDEWRKLAYKESQKINSVGLYTNIEAVLRNVSFDWNNADPRYQRNLILLTDGHVDVSKDDKLNKASRKRILEELLPKFEKAKVRIHTIALSDDVDESLLTTLSAYTDGLYKKVKSADDLQKLFLQMLEQSVKLDTLPIKDNVFNVDKSIDDMTLLVFNKDKKHPTIIITPDHKNWTASSHPSKVKWSHDDGYDLITIKKPQSGAWKIKAPTDKNNRVVVATNLKLKLKPLPSYLLLGDSLSVTGNLEEDGRPLTDGRLLSRFKFSVEREAQRSSERKYPLHKTQNDDFSYTVQLSPRFKEGNNEIIIRAKSSTVERELHHQFKVYATPAEVKITKEHSNYLLSIKPSQSILRPDSVKINIELEDGTHVTLKRHGDKWQTEVNAEYKDSFFKININATAADGKPVHFNFNKKLTSHGGSIKLDLAEKFKEQKPESHAQDKPHETSMQKDEHAAPKHEAKKEDHEESKHDAPEEKHDKNAAVENEQGEESAEEETNWTLIISAIVGGNLLLGGIGFGAYTFVKRRKAKLTEELEEELNNDDDKKEEKEK